MLLIQEANSEEINTLISIYMDKVKWLRSVNKPLWDESQFKLENLITKYGQPVFYAGCVNNVIIGGFILVESDKQYWPEIIVNDSYYFHKFVIKNEYCGNGYADEMITWVKDHGKSNNKKFIRLDYDGDRKPIRKLYTRNGFVPVDIIRNAHVTNLIKAEFKIQ